MPEGNLYHVATFCLSTLFPVFDAIGGDWEGNDTSSMGYDVCFVSGRDKNSLYK